MRKSIIFAVFSIVMYGFLAFAGEADPYRKTLQGIKEFSIFVEQIEPEIGKEGLTRQQIQKDVEQNVSQAGIKLTNEGMRPVLYVKVTTLKRDDLKGYIYDVDVNVRQDVKLLRDLFFIGCRATTWSTSSVGFISGLDLIKNIIKGQVDIFIDAYFSVNPKVEGRNNKSG